MKHREFLQYRRQRSVEFFEILKRKHLARNLAEHRRDAVLLVEKIRAKPGNVWDLVTEVHIASFFESLYFILWGNFVEHLFKLVIVQRWVLHTVQFTVNAEHRIIVRRKVQV